MWWLFVTLIYIFMSPLSSLLWTTPSKYRDDTTEKFLDQVIATATICRQRLINNILMKWLTREQWREYNNATNCSICIKPFISADKRVHNVNHLTDEYRGPADNSCNLNCRIHIFLANIRNYSCEARNIQWREAELNINLLRVNNFNIKEKIAWKQYFKLHALRAGPSIFIYQIIVVVESFICWAEWFATDQAIGGIVVFPPLFLGQPFHRDLISQMLSTDGSCS